MRESQSYVKKTYVKTEYKTRSAYSFDDELMKTNGEKMLTQLHLV